MNVCGIFITGTDTGCGKTHVACALIRALRAQGLRVAPYKPVAAGADDHAEVLRNEDALQLMAAAGGDWDYQQVNPYCLPAAISPHLAARQVGITIEQEVIVAGLQALAQQADIVVVEGAGGWLVPLGDILDIETLAIRVGLPVLLVIGLRLGCLNHAALSAQAIQQSKVPVLGWIGSQVDPLMQRVDENRDTLQQQLAMPDWGTVPHGALAVTALDKLAGHLCAGHFPSNA